MRQTSSGSELHVVLCKLTLGKGAASSAVGSEPVLRGCGRRHAALAAEDELISTLFATECWTDAANYFARKPVRRFCVSDEHYLPTLLAHHGEVLGPVFKSQLPACLGWV
jgi:hypothetical protein